MAVRTTELSQVRSLEEHLELALSLEPDEVDGIRALAAQLKGEAVVPIFGAGVSYDCGMRLAGDIATDLHTDCCADEGLSPQMGSIGERELGEIAEAIYTYRDNSQQAVLEAIGMPDPVRWPGTPEVDSHLCALRILARAVREQEGLGQAFSFNYDCCTEAALRFEGFRVSRETRVGHLWPDHAHFICSKETYVNRGVRKGFELVKVHGCSEHYREAYRQSESEEVAEAIVIRTEQIDTWKDRLWAKRALADPAQKSILLLIGFSGEDRATAKELQEVLEDARKADQDVAPPRLVVIDHDPDTEALQGLIDCGVGPGGIGGADVTRVSTATSSTTAVLMVLLAEMIALELEPAMIGLGLSLSPDLDVRLGLLTLAGPAMARWSFLLGKADETYLQWVNDGSQIHDYVPLRHDPQSVARAFRIREEMRKELGFDVPEGAAELIGTDGFIVYGGCAYLPVGIDLATVRDAHLGGGLEQAKDVLPWPRDMESILVYEEDGIRKGFSIARGKEVPVP